jgi:hypothetical protein
MSCSRKHFLSGASFTSDEHCCLTPGYGRNLLNLRKQCWTFSNQLFQTDRLLQLGDDVICVCLIAQSPKARKNINRPERRRKEISRSHFQPSAQIPRVVCSRGNDDGHALEMPLHDTEESLSFLAAAFRKSEDNYVRSPMRYDASGNSRGAGQLVNPKDFLAEFRIE